MEDIRKLLVEVTDEQIAAEIAHEESMVEIGVQRFEKRVLRERQAGQWSMTPGCRMIISALHEPLADGIVDELAALEAGKGKRKPPEIKTLKLLPARDLAGMTISAALDTIGSAEGGPRGSTTQQISYKIGEQVSFEVMSRELRKDEKALYDSVVRKVRSRSSSSSKLQKELVEARKNTDGIDPLTKQEKMRLGLLVVTIMERVGILTALEERKGKRVTKYFTLSDEAFAIIDKTNDAAALMKPYLMPTIVPPQPWIDRTTGGYWYPTIKKRMIVSRNVSNGVRSANAENMPKVFDSVNYLQSVPFRINRKVLHVARHMRDKKIECSSLPAFVLEDLPPKPHDIDVNEEARKVYRYEAREVYARNATRKGQILAVGKVLSVAEEMYNYPAIYFPKVIDFRGRVYDLPLYLKPQGDDLSKGVLEFAHGKPLGEVGAYWLAIHGANTWGEDKVSYADREKWVFTNEERIKAAASDPVSERFWMDADKPFQFLAFCFEWAGYCEQGEDFVSHIPVAMDGSCNGLQHLSAMLRDEVGGAAVNLLPADKPQDIYTAVMEKALVVLKERAANGEPTAQKWIPLMKRKVVKRPVMTLPYGATKQGFADQIMEDTLRPLKKESGETPFESDFEAARYLADILWEATGGVVIAARKVMDWLQSVAKVASKTGKGIEWRTASGFTVRQDYRDCKEDKLEITSQGKRICLRTAGAPKDKVNKRKMTSSISPNFVHAMDASHMLLTIQYLLDTKGPIMHLSMVHDSYASHAADGEDLAYALRLAFIQMYQEANWLEAFRDQVKQQIPQELWEELPPVPSYGGLELSEVANALYFFG